MLLENFIKRLGVAKKQNASRPKELLFKKEIQNFMFDNFDVNNDLFVQQFFSNLHKIDYDYLFNKTFYLKIANPDKLIAGSFIKNKDVQTIRLNKIWKSTAPNLLKKGILLNTYFHENTHERQYDKFIYYTKNPKLKCSAYQKILNFEFSCEEKFPHYNFKLQEIDARLETLDRLCELLRNGTVQYNDVLMVDPVLNILKNISALTNINEKEEFFNNKQNFNASKHIYNYQNIDDILFETDNYINMYEKILNNLDSVKITKIKAQEVFSDPTTRYEFKKQFDEKLEKYKNNIKYIYQFIENEYIPSLEVRRFLPINCTNRTELKNIKHNHQIAILKVMRKDLFDKYIVNETKNNYELNN